MRASQMQNYVLQGGLWVPSTHVDMQRLKFERMLEVAKQLNLSHKSLLGLPDSIMAMALTGQTSQIDKLQVGFSPRFTAINAGALVRKGVGIAIAVTLTAAAGANTQLWDNTVGGGSSNQLFNGPTTLGPGTYWLYAAFANDLNYVIATAVTDMVVITAGI
jgi:hypothetical protein